MCQTPPIPGLVDAARRLARRSEARFSVEALASEMGVSRSTLYRAFPNRKALLDHLAAAGVALEPEGIRERILAAAVRTYEALGLRDATMEAIAERAGVAPITVYRQFGNRELLLNAAMEESSPRAAGRALTLHPTEDLEGDLARLATVALAFIAEHTGVLRMALGATPVERKRLKKLRQAPRGTTAALKTWFKQQMKMGRIAKQDPQQLAIAFSGLIVTFGYIAPAFEDLPLKDPEAMGRRLARLFLRGALAGPGKKI